MRPLITQRYPWAVQVARIFRDGQPINRIRVDFRSNEDVWKILQRSRILMDSIRYPAVLYKPLARIDRCSRCQMRQFQYQQEEKNSANNQQSSTSYSLFSCSTVLQTMAPHAHVVTKTWKMPTDRSSETIDPRTASSFRFFPFSFSIRKA